MAVNNFVFVEYILNIKLKNEQKEVINKVLTGKSVLCVLSTGFGRSVCFIAPILMMNEKFVFIYLLNKPDVHKVALVISPLKSLMLNQVEGLKKKGIDAMILTADTAESITESPMEVLYTSPEMVLSDSGREVLSKIVDRVAVLAFDEAHCISEWDNDFRRQYKELVLLRSIISKAPVAVFTATCTNNMADEIRETLLLDDETHIVAVVPDRPNININIKENVKSMKELNWYVDMLRVQGIHAPKAILYTRSLSSVGDIYAHIMHNLGTATYQNKARCIDNRLIDVYHGSSTESDKDRITNIFVNSMSNIRLVIATVAFGMGVDVSDIRYVLHWGVSKSPLSYWQEVGRCARDGDYGDCYMYLIPRTLDPRTVDSNMRRHSFEDYGITGFTN